MANREIQKKIRKMRRARLTKPARKYDATLLREFYNRRVTGYTEREVYLQALFPTFKAAGTNPKLAAELRLEQITMEEPERNICLRKWEDWVIRMFWTDEQKFYWFVEERVGVYIRRSKLIGGRQTALDAFNNNTIPWKKKILLFTT